MQLEIYISALFFLIGAAAFSLILFVSIQEGQWLDVVLKWQSKLRKWDSSGTKQGMILSKIFGYCEICFSHMVAFVWFWIMIVCLAAVYDFSIPKWTYPFFYLIYVSISTNLNLYFITKLFKP